LAVDENRLATNVPGVFAGGDFVSGPGMVIEAIAAGRRGAIAIDKYLRGDATRVEMYDLKPSVPPPVIAKSVSDEAMSGEETWEPQFRPETPHIALRERKGSFKEIELAFSEEKAKQEAKRCLRCDLEK
jgi:NADH-quinone oxidoreductase subunit F